jgi:hypothetical protein
LADAKLAADEIERGQRQIQPEINAPDPMDILPGEKESRPKELSQPEANEAKGNSKMPITAQSKPDWGKTILKWAASGMLVVGVLSLAWAFRFKYDRLENKPIRINRFTGKAEMLDGLENSFFRLPDPAPCDGGLTDYS